MKKVKLFLARDEADLRDFDDQNMIERHPERRIDLTELNLFYDDPVLVQQTAGENFKRWGDARKVGTIPSYMYPEIEECEKLVLEGTVHDADEIMDKLAAIDRVEKMKDTDKDLLFQELSMRLPHGLMCKLYNESKPLKLVGLEIGEKGIVVCQFEGEKKALLSEFKPILRSMKKMSDEKKKEIRKILAYYQVSAIQDRTMIEVKMTWLLQNHYDYRCMIEKGLALEDTTGIYGPIEKGEHDYDTCRLILE